jgi:DNA-binding transcriptional ArsR family regulator
MKLEDVTGKSLLAIKVFGLSLRALTSHMLKLLESEGTNIKPREIKWVIVTVQHTYFIHTRVTGRMPLVEQELLTLLGRLRSSTVF